MLKSDGIRTPPETWLRRAGTWSPLRRLNIRSSDRSHSAWLKLEMFNPAGSVKYRTALSLLRALDQDRPLVPGTTIVESTSGNLGLALAELSAEIGCHFVAVVDPKLPLATHAAMAAAGADIIAVGDPDQHHSHLTHGCEWFTNCAPLHHPCAGRISTRERLIPPFTVMSQARSSCARHRGSLTWWPSP